LERRNNTAIYDSIPLPNQQLIRAPVTNRDFKLGLYPKFPALQMAQEWRAHSVAEPELKLASAAEADSRVHRYGRAEARPSWATKIRGATQRIYGLVVQKGEEENLLGTFMG
jgi:hypothetical protein